MKTVSTQTEWQIETLETQYKGGAEIGAKWVNWDTIATWGNNRRAATAKAGRFYRYVNRSPSRRWRLKFIRTTHFDFSIVVGANEP